MSKSTKRGRDQVEDYDSDGGFVAKEGAEEGPKKKSKMPSTSGKTQDDGNDKYWELSSGRAPRRVGISKFKDAHLISIREFYRKDDDYLPGKKGISLNIEQYQALLRAIPEINANLKELGVEVMQGDEIDSTAITSNKKSAPKKKSKANIDATSDEEE